MKEFIKGQFVKLEAKTTIHLGRLEMNLNPGDIIEYDGSTLKIGTQETSMPELKAGIKRGWLKSADSVSTEPKTEPVKVAPKVKEMPVEKVYDEETPVGTVSEQTAEPASKELSLEEKFPLQVSEMDEDTQEVATISDSSGADINLTSSGESAGQEAVAVSAKIKTATQKKTVLSDSSSIESEIRSLENLEVESFPVVVSEQDDAVEINSDLAQTEEEEAELELELELELEEEAPAIEGELEQVLKAVESDAPQQGAIEVGEESKIKVLPSGIEWDMGVFWSTRAKNAVELYADNPTILDEIKAIESAGVVKAIDKKLAATDS